ncbi:MAG: hypothetical protein AAF928_00750 [Myxococcota bacterium]
MTRSPRDVPALDQPIVLALIGTAAWALLLAIGAAATAGWGPAVSTGLGGLLAVANLAAFAFIGRGVLGGGPRARFWGLMGTLKFAALLGVGFLLLRHEGIDGFAFAVGYGALPLGVASSAFAGGGEPGARVEGDAHPEDASRAGDDGRDLVGESPNEGPHDGVRFR